MLKWSCLLLNVLLSASLFSQGIPPVGQWREHLPWNNAIRVAADGKEIITATPYALFRYDLADGSFTRKSKINGLTGVGLSTMQFDPQTGKTVIAYLNSDLDILDGGNVTNIPDIRLSTVAGDKSIRDVFISDGRAYLSTGIGIIVVSLSRYEVEDTWRIGAGGNPVDVNAFTISGGYYYAATGQGLLRSAQNLNPADYRNWNNLSGTVGLPPGASQQVTGFSGEVLVRQGDTLFRSAAGLFSVFYISQRHIQHTDISGGQVLVSESLGNKGRVVQLDNSGTVSKIFEPPALSLPRQALLLDSECWIADQNNGLFRASGTTGERIFPNSPINIASGEMRFFGNTLWAAAGTVNDAWNYTYNPNGIYRFMDGTWDGYNLYVYPQLDSMLDFITLAEQPSTGSVFAGSFGGGLLEIKKDNSLVLYKQNSPLQPAIGDPGSYRVSGLATDAASNIWISNYGAPQDLLVKKSDGQWKSFTIPFYHVQNAVSSILVDDYDQKWIISPKENGLFLFNSGSSIDNTGDDRWRFYRKGKGSGNLPSNNVLSIMKDRNGLIWVGTDQGIGIIPCVQDAAGSNCDAVWPVVKQDNFAGYLFQDEEVRAMATDGANRKWVGTKNGLWLVSPEGDKIIYRFTVDNSPLLANEISALTIDPESGELFVSTSSGICSFRSTATEGGDTQGSVLVFPNPVPPGYGGTIAIRGLATDSWVKITEMDGRLVYQTRALGGQAVWDGRNYKGQKVSSGVYLVLVADEMNKDKVVTKIFFIR